VTRANYTQVECGVMLALMAEARRLSLVDLQELYKLKLSKRQREKLEGAGLIEVGSGTNPRTGRSVNTLELTERGWAWAGEEITEPLPTKYQSMGPLYAVLNNLARYLKRQGIGLADVFGRTNENAPPFTEAKPGGAVDLEAQVKRAYQELARRPGARVRLADLRDQLDAVPRSDLDPELTRLSRAQQVLLEPEDNPVRITDRDRAAALPLGGEQRHWILVR